MGLEYIGVRLVGMVSLKGLDEIDVGEIVLFAPGDVETTPIDGADPLILVIRQEFHQDRDPEKFPDADRIVIDRKENPHVAFGLGIHRCIGSNLARMEMRIAVEEWLKRIPDFGLDPSKPMTWSQGTVRGPRLLPITFG